MLIASAASDPFTGGFVTIGSVSSTTLVGELDWNSVGGDHVSGSFSLEACPPHFQAGVAQ